MAAAVARGKKIFDERVEYPLPVKTGVKDYVFYFVPNDGYGKGARRFFAKFYPRHVAQQSASLEDLVAYLAGEIRANRVTRIREIVIVSHGHSTGLIRPVLRSVPPANPEYNYVTAYSLTCLQKDLSDGKFPTFNDDRRLVASKLDQESWITVRACNFGKSGQGMYALFSFFGGRAQVYSPLEYQFFGWHPVMEGFSVQLDEVKGQLVSSLRKDHRKLESRLAVHSHLVKQRFLPHDRHTPDRIDAVVKMFLDKAKFSEPVTLASKRTSDNTSPEAVQYEAFVDSLNARKLTPALRAVFTAKQMPLSAAAKAAVERKDAEWVITDSFKHEGNPCTVKYTVTEQPGTDSSNQPIVALFAQAQITSFFSSHAGLPVQSFFYGGDHALWEGRLFTLAFYTEHPDEDPALEQKFNAVVQQLDQLKLIAPGGVDIPAEYLKAARIVLSPTATVTLLSSTGSGDKRKAVWRIVDANAAYQIKLTHPATDNAVQAHALMVYKHLDDKARLLHECEVLQFIGQDPDTPGTELAAYLDRFSIDDLIALIDYLRTPYRPENSFYIHHAQQAIQRKKEYVTWWESQYGEAARTQPLVRQPYAELDSIEREDKRQLVYDFDFSKSWREVRASNPPGVPVQQDLFREELLWKRLKIPEDALTQRLPQDQIDPDSPFGDDDTMRLAEFRGLERYKAVEKDIFDRPVTEDEDVSCAELEQVLTKWKDLQSEPPDEIERILETFTTSKGRTFGQTIAHYWEKFKITEVLMTANLWNIASVKEGLLVNIASRIPIVSNSLGAMTFLRIMPAISIPVGLWMKVLKEQVNTRNIWEEVGRITAIRQWLRILEDQTFRFENNFPDPIQIDVKVSLSTVDPYHISRYCQELQQSGGGFPKPCVYSAPDRMKMGFDKGALMMDQAAPEMLAKADEVIDAILGEFKLDPCKIDVLKKVGIVDVSKMRALILRAMANKLLEQLPKP